ncbi:MBL fold metallo-hydrolase [Terasakiella sp. A23]|uniref:MBL fold metallo-hydrolase n=1 Tax=Terasakiella sp. FCG-A23 TaxID=3080561 RepID=UPI0029543DEF|nr:MBL fold metallo-hydrolase [Terasakiella sp. A23]MDV7339842.1 MBL fold metallo-hydrolase [Terasakiella sp. A23]
MRFLPLFFILLFTTPPTFALEIQPVTDGIYALVGETEQRSETNLANNATFGVVVTDDGLILIDAGGSREGAKKIHDTIRTFSQKPVKYVINTGGQDHRWLGNGYWQDLGAQVIASRAAVEDQKERSDLQLSALKQFLGAKLEGTVPSFANITFDESHSLAFGGLEIVIEHPAAAHTPGDSIVWVKSKGTLFSGDIIYVERILGVGEQSNSKDWIAAFERIKTLAPKHIIPGHGPATDLKTATKQTYDYLVNLRQKIREHLEAGGDMITAPKVDQSDFKYLKQFSSLAGRNAQQVFSEMEWEE